MINDKKKTKPLIASQRLVGSQCVHNDFWNLNFKQFLYIYKNFIIIKNITKLQKYFKIITDNPRCETEKSRFVKDAEFSVRCSCSSRVSLVVLFNFAVSFFVITATNVNNTTVV